MTTTIVSIDELNTATEMPRQMESPSATPENTPAFDEAVTRFQTALGDEGLKLDAESLGLGTVATGEMPVATATGKTLDAPATGMTLDVPESGKMPVATATGMTLDVQETAEMPVVQKMGKMTDLPDVEESMIRQFEDSTISPDHPEAQVVLQAAPMMTVPLESGAIAQQVSDSLKVTSVESAAALRSQMLVSSVEEVCEAIQVSPGVQPGQGEVRIQLKADVLSGTVVFLEAKGTTITVAFNPATADVAEVLSRNITQFEQHLAGRVHNYQISARVRKLKS